MSRLDKEHLQKFFTGIDAKEAPGLRDKLEKQFSRIEKLATHKGLDAKSQSSQFISIPEQTFAFKDGRQSMLKSLECICEDSIKKISAYKESYSEPPSESVKRIDKLIEKITAIKGKAEKQIKAINHFTAEAESKLNHLNWRWRNILGRRQQPTHQTNQNNEKF